MLYQDSSAIGDKIVKFEKPEFFIFNQEKMDAYPLLLVPPPPNNVLNAIC
jgi:hypothetical protein